MALLVKTLNGLAYASVKERNGLALASVKAFNGVDASEDADYLDFLARVASNGGTLSGGTQTAVRNWILSAKSNNYWADILRGNLFCGDYAASVVPIKIGGGNTVDTNNGFVSGDYSEATGYTGNGSSKFFDTGIIPSSMMTANSTHLCGYIRSGGGNAFLGSVNVSDQLQLSPKNGSNIAASTQYANQDSGLIQSAASGSVGTILGVRRTSTDHKIYANGSQVASGTGSVTGTFSNLTNSFYVFARNTGAGANSFSSHVSGGYTIGAGVDATKAAAMATDMQTFQTALGRNV